MLWTIIRTITGELWNKLLDLGENKSLLRISRNRNMVKDTQNTLVRQENKHKNPTQCKKNKMKLI